MIVYLHNIFFLNLVYADFWVPTGSKALLEKKPRRQQELRIVCRCRISTWSDWPSLLLAESPRQDNSKQFPVRLKKKKIIIYYPLVLTRPTNTQLKIRIRVINIVHNMVYFNNTKVEPRMIHETAE